MLELIRLIEKNIQKKKVSEWSYEVNLRDSCIHSDNYSLLSAKIYGEGSIRDLIKVKVEFFVSNSQKINTRIKKFRGIEKAIIYIWDFPESYKLCMNCCSLVRKGKDCEECLFYKSYMEYKKKKELCGICQEESYRTILTCKHHFHKYCLLKMDPEDLKCPLCRHPVEEETICSIFDEDVDSEEENQEIFSEDEYDDDEDDKKQDEDDKKQENQE